MRSLIQYINENINHFICEAEDSGSFVFYKLIEYNGKIKGIEPNTEESHKEILGWNVEEYKEIIEKSISLYVEDNEIKKLIMSFLDKPIEEYFKGDKHDLIDLPIAFNRKKKIKLRRTIADKCKISQIEINQAGLKSYIEYGDGSISFSDKHVDDKDHERATAWLFNKMVIQENPNKWILNQNISIFDENEFKDDLDEVWKQSCIYQCQLILKYLENKNIKNFKDYKAIRYGDDKENEVYKNYSYIISLFNDGKKTNRNNIDPSDIIIFNTKLYKNYFREFGDISNDRTAICEKIKGGISKGIVIGISLKQCSSNSRYQEMNIEKIEDKDIVVKFIDSENNPKISGKDNKKQWTIYCSCKLPNDEERNLEIYCRFAKTNKDLMISGKEVGSKSQFSRVPVASWRKELNIDNKEDFNNIDLVIERLNEKIKNEKEKENFIKYLIKEMFRMNNIFNLPYLFVH